jgi:hypothetical protein
VSAGVVRAPDLEPRIQIATVLVLGDERRQSGTEVDGLPLHFTLTQPRRQLQSVGGLPPR